MTGGFLGDAGEFGPAETHRWTSEQMAAMRAAFAGNRWAAFTDDELASITEEFAWAGAGRADRGTLADFNRTEITNRIEDEVTAEIERRK